MRARPFGWFRLAWQELLLAVGETPDATQSTLTGDAGTFTANGTDNITFTYTPADESGTTLTNQAWTATVERVLLSAGNSTVSPSPATIANDGVESVDLTVYVEDADGYPAPNVAVTLASTGTGNTITQPASRTNAAGVATGSMVSTVAEAKTITATVNGLAITDTATVTVSGTGGLTWGYDPVANSFTNIVNREYSTLATSNGDRGTGTYPDKTGGSEGWDGTESSNPTTLTLVTDATAPLSPSSVIRAEYTAGTVTAGTTYSPGTHQTLPFTGSGHGSRTDTEIYYRGAFKLSSNWQEHPNGASPKLMFLRSNGSPRVDNVLMVDYVATDFVLAWNLQGSVLDGREQIDANENAASAIIALDTWVRYEVRAKLNTLGNADGILQIWKDGTRIFNYSDIEFLPTTVTQLYWSTGHFNSTWGGQGGTIDETMYLYWDAAYFWGKA